MADLCRAAQGAQGPPAAAPQLRTARSSAAAREAALLAAEEDEDGLPVALPMPSGIATHLELEPRAAEAPEYPWRRGERSPLRA